MGTLALIKWVTQGRWLVVARTAPPLHAVFLYRSSVVSKASRITLFRGHCSTGAEDVSDTIPPRPPFPARQRCRRSFLGPVAAASQASRNIQALPSAAAVRVGMLGFPDNGKRNALQTGYRRRQTTVVRCGKRGVPDRRRKGLRRRWQHRWRLQRYRRMRVMGSERERRL